MLLEYMSMYVLYIQTGTLPFPGWHVTRPFDLPGSPSSALPHPDTHPSP